MANFNPESPNSRPDSELYQDAAVNFEKGIDLSTADRKIIRKYIEDAVDIFEEDIDLSTADDKIIKEYVNYKFLVYREYNMQDTSLRSLIKEEFADFTEDY